MMTIRRAEERGDGSGGWLKTRFTFSFADYYDPKHMGFRALRVINDDWVAADKGFQPHPHRDMEIITYVLEGKVAHRDSMGNTTVIPAGEVQRMTAGTGVVHSELNPSKDEKLHLLQIWILPEKKGLTPGYEQHVVPESEKRNQLRRIASRDGADGALTIHQDAQLFATVLHDGERVTHRLPPGRHAWVHIARGTMRVNGELLKDGDGAALSELDEVQLEGADKGEALLFDLG